MLGSTVTNIHEMIHVLIADIGIGASAGFSDDVNLGKSVNYKARVHELGSTSSDPRAGER